MLVIDVTLNDVQGYYPIELPPLEYNKYYTIEEVILTKEPSDNPWEPANGSVKAVISVVDWEDGFDEPQTYTI